MSLENTVLKWYTVAIVQFVYVTGFCVKGSYMYIQFFNFKDT